MTHERKYKLSENIMLVETKHALRAEVKTSEHSSTSIGILKPYQHQGVVDVLYSRDGQYYYIPELAWPVAMWLSVEYVDSEILDVVTFKKEGLSDLYRKGLPFAFYDVKSGETKQVRCTDQLVLDYLVLYQQEMQRQEKQFNKVIESSGRKLNWILKQLLPWVEPAETIIDLTQERVVEHSGLVYTKDNLPDRSNFEPYVKCGVTYMMRIKGPFAVNTLEGVMTCQDGFLAIDAKGNPYPIDAVVQLESYVLQPGYKKG